MNKHLFFEQNPDFHGNETADKTSISLLQSKLGLSLPSDFIYFLTEIANGGTGKIRDKLVNIWSTDQCVDLNKSYGVEEFLPGFVLCGSDGCGQAFGFKINGRSPDEVVSVPFIPMSEEYVESVAKTFGIFVGCR